MLKRFGKRRRICRHEEHLKAIRATTISITSSDGRDDVQILRFLPAVASRVNGQINRFADELSMQMLCRSVMSFGAPWVPRTSVSVPRFGIKLDLASSSESSLQYRLHQRIFSCGVLVGKPGKGFLGENRGA